MKTVIDKNGDTSYEALLARWFELPYGTPQELEVLSNLAEQGNRFQAEIAAKIQKQSISSNQSVNVVGMYYYRIYNGGIERVVCNLAALLYSNGFRVILFTDEAENELDYALPAHGIKRIILPNRDKLRERIVCWRELLIEEGVDVLISHAWLSSCLLWDILAIRGAGVRYIQYTHGVFTSLLIEPSIEMNKVFFQLPMIYRLTDSVVSLSRVDALFWRQYANYSHVVINPPTFNVYEISANNEITNRILWVGRLVYQKQPLEAIRIFAIAAKQDPSIVLDMVGCGEHCSLWEEKLYLLISEFGLNGRVFLHGYQQNIAPFYRNACLFLSTSCYEGAPMALQESKAYGLPAVCYDLPYLEAMRKPRGLVTVPQKDARAAADAIIRIMHNSDEYNTLSNEARASSEAEANIDYIAMWQNILSNKAQFDEYDSETQTIMMNIIVDHFSIAQTFAAEQRSIPMLRKLTRTVFVLFRKWYGFFSKLKSYLLKLRKE